MYDQGTLTKWDKKYVWHPFTQMEEYVDSAPLIIEEGEGSSIDVEGNRYIDGVSSLWVLVHGHGKRELIDAIEKQSNMLCHSTLLGLGNTPSIVLARMLVNLAQGPQKSFLFRQRFHFSGDCIENGLSILAAEG